MNWRFWRHEPRREPEDDLATMLTHRTETDCLVWRMWTREDRDAVPKWPPVTDVCTDFAANDGDHIWQFGELYAERFLLFDKQIVEADQYKLRILFRAIWKQHERHNVLQVAGGGERCR